MSISVFDLFKIGIGPSSSHTVGPMRAAKLFAEKLSATNQLAKVHQIKAEMFGSLGATGKGHGTPKAIMLGLEGETPEAVVIENVDDRIATIRNTNSLKLLGQHTINFFEDESLILHRRKSLPYHSNGMTFTAQNLDGGTLLSSTYYSVGGGFVIDEKAAGNDCLIVDQRKLAYPFSSGNKLLALCNSSGLSIACVMRENEKSWRPEQQTNEGLLRIKDVMQECIDTGCSIEGVLPGGLKVKRRAASLYQQLLKEPEAALTDTLVILDWVTLYALAVNEENAAGGRVVTAPTNGAAGIIPAVLNYYLRFIPNANDAGIIRFLLTAAAIGILYKENASISGAEVGCQGEVGSACSMAAAGLTEVLGGSPQQVENAAEIAMEHNLGLTCDPIGGLVQVPCIERNAMASMKAINAARIAMRGDGSHFVSLDQVIKTMRDTGRDMQDKYKETSLGGLAINVIEVPINVVEC